MEDGIPFNKHYSTLPLLQQTLQILYGFSSYPLAVKCEGYAFEILKKWV